MDNSSEPRKLCVKCLNFIPVSALQVKVRGPHKRKILVCNACTLFVKERNNTA